MPFTALHRSLGRPPGPITEELLDAAIAAELPESDDLDWKSELPPTKDINKTDFPKDVAAMANSGGGLIVYGVTEKEKRASGRKDTGELTEIHERTLVAAAWSSVVPPVFNIQIFRIGLPGNQAVAVHIPSSVDGPHLIFKGEYFGAPLRYDADTKWMRERQLEQGYRSRFDDRRLATSSLDSMYNETRARMGDSGAAWFVAVARPRVLAEPMYWPPELQAISVLGEAAAFGERVTGRGISPLSSVDREAVKPGLRRWIAPDDAKASGWPWREAWASVHHDGSLSLAFSIGGHRTMNETLRGEQVELVTLERSLADFMGMIRALGRVRGVSEYDSRVGIEWASNKPLLIMKMNYSTSELTDTVSTPLSAFAPVNTTVRSDVNSAESIRQLYDLARDCVNQAGFTELDVIDPLESPYEV